MATDLKELTAEVVASFVEHNSVGPAALPALIRGVFDALRSAGEPAPAAPVESTKATVGAIRKSLANPAYLISFIDGKPYKTLRRHIGTHGMTQAEYCEKYGLPKDYPMTSINTSTLRTQTALKFGLGRKKAQAPVKATPKARKPRPAKAIDPAEETFT